MTTTNSTMDVDGDGDGKTQEQEKALTETATISEQQQTGDEIMVVDGNTNTHKLVGSNGSDGDFDGEDEAALHRRQNSSIGENTINDGNGSDSEDDLKAGLPSSLVKLKSLRRFVNKNYGASSGAKVGDKDAGGSNGSLSPGELNKLMDMAIDAGCFDSPNSLFGDIGGAEGFVSCFVSEKTGRPCVSLEINKALTKVAFIVARKNMTDAMKENEETKVLLGNDWEGPPLPQVVPLCKDLHDAKSFLGITVVYVFGSAMSPDDYKCIAKKCDETKSVQYIIFGQRTPSDELTKHGLTRFSLMLAPHDMEGIPKGEPLRKSFTMACGKTTESKMFSVYKRVSSSGNNLLPEDNDLTKAISLASGPSKDRIDHLNAKIEEYLESGRPLKKIVECPECGGGFYTRQHTNVDGKIVAEAGQICSECTNKATTIAGTDAGVHSGGAAASSSSSSSSSGTLHPVPPTHSSTSRDDKRFEIGSTHVTMETDTSLVCLKLGGGVYSDEVITALKAKNKSASDRWAHGLNAGFNGKMVPSGHPVPLVPCILSDNPIDGRVDSIPQKSHCILAYVRTPTGVRVVLYNNETGATLQGAWSTYAKQQNVANKYISHDFTDDLRDKFEKAIVKEASLKVYVGAEAKNDEIGDLREKVQHLEEENKNLKNQLNQKEQSLKKLQQEAVTSKTSYDELDTKCRNKEDELKKMKKQLKATAAAPAGRPPPAKRVKLNVPKQEQDQEEVQPVSSNIHPGVYGSAGALLSGHDENTYVDALPYTVSPSTFIQQPRPHPALRHPYDFSMGPRPMVASHSHHGQRPSPHIPLPMHTNQLRPVMMVSNRQQQGGVSSNHLQAGGHATHYHGLHATHSPAYGYAQPTAMHVPQQRQTTHPSLNDPVYPCFPEGCMDYEYPY